MVAGTWNIHGTRASVAELIEGLGRQVLPGSGDIAVMPSSLFVNQVIEWLEATSIIVGAQDASIQAELGALTGEVASSQLADA
ncbi:triose-phosphate isomerase, partial [Pseudomonas syringae group genomosp. 7]|uniref:triose-phosphate isomerase n=1 Tax=Pseudomonas syringae group genomosp. 7 TaxID=251699 RepID=UPI00376FFAAC